MHQTFESRIANSGVSKGGGIEAVSLSIKYLTWITPNFPSFPVLVQSLGTFKFLSLRRLSFPPWAALPWFYPHHNMDRPFSN